jgi:hypothetical protein
MNEEKEKKIYLSKIELFILSGAPNYAGLLVAVFFFCCAPVLAPTIRSYRCSGC